MNLFIIAILLIYIPLDQKTEGFLGKITFVQNSTLREIKKNFQHLNQ